MSYPNGTRVRTTQDIEDAQQQRTILKGTRGTTQRYSVIFDSYDVRFEGFDRELLVPSQQLETA